MAAPEKGKDEPENKVFKLEDMEEMRDFLQENMHTFCLIIKPQKFFTWLRSKSILSEDDQDDIESPLLPGRRDKARKLIDIIRTKGKKGFEGFMEVLEYEYPDYYQNITKCKPRRPPRKYIGSVRCSTFLVTDLIPQLLMQEKVKDSFLLHQIKLEHERMKKKMDELENIEDDGNKMKRELEKKDSIIGELKDRCLKYLMEKDSIQEFCADISKEKDDACTQLRQLQEEHDTLVAVNKSLQNSIDRQRSKTQRSKTPSEEIKALQEQNRFFKEQLQKRYSYSPETTDIPQASQENGMQQVKVEILTQELGEVKSHNEQLGAKYATKIDEANELEEKLTELQERYDKLEEEKSRLQDEAVISKQRHEKYFKLYQTTMAERDERTKQRDLSQADCKEKTKQLDKAMEDLHEMYIKLENLEKEITEKAEKMEEMKREITCLQQNISGSMTVEDKYDYRNSIGSSTSAEDDGSSVNGRDRSTKSAGEIHRDKDIVIKTSERIITIPKKESPSPVFRENPFKEFPFFRTCDRQVSQEGHSSSLVGRNGRNLLTPVEIEVIELKNLINQWNANTIYQRKKQISEAEHKKEQRLHFIGGNCTGVFVYDAFESRQPGEEFANTKLKKGDQILRIYFSDDENESGSTASSMSPSQELLTLEEANIVFSNLGTDVNVINYYDAQVFLQTNDLCKAKDNSGDCFCVRVEREGTAMKIGAIMMVRNTVFDNASLQTCWSGYVLDSNTGNMMNPITVSSPRIPDYPALTDQKKLQAFLETPILPYVYVTPQKVTYKKPVLLFGSEECVQKCTDSLIEKNVCNHCRWELLNCEPKQEAPKKLKSGELLSFDLKRTPPVCIRTETLIGQLKDSSTHVIIGGTTDVVSRMYNANLFPIVIFLKNRNPTLQAMTEFESISNILKSKAIGYEEVKISSGTPTGRELSQLISTIDSEQNCLVWLEGKRPSPPFNYKIN